MKKRIILHHYLHCALWTAELDNNRDIDEISKKSISQARKDVKLFVDKNKNLLVKSGLSDEQIGHDFWLTRCGHGTGFWDRSLGVIGKMLTTACKKFNELNVFDDAEVIIE